MTETGAPPTVGRGRQKRDQGFGALARASVLAGAGSPHGRARPGLRRAGALAEAQPQGWGRTDQGAAWCSSCGATPRLGSHRSRHGLIIELQRYPGTPRGRGGGASAEGVARCPTCGAPRGRGGEPPQRALARCLLLEHPAGGAPVHPRGWGGMKPPVSRRHRHPLRAGPDRERVHGNLWVTPPRRDHGPGGAIIGAGTPPRAGLRRWDQLRLLRHTPANSVEQPGGCATIPPREESGAPRSRGCERRRGASTIRDPGHPSKGFTHASRSGLAVGASRVDSGAGPPRSRGAGVQVWGVLLAVAGTAPGVGAWSNWPRWSPGAPGSPRSRGTGARGSPRSRSAGVQVWGVLLTMAGATPRDGAWPNWPCWSPRATGSPRSLGAGVRVWRVPRCGDSPKGRGVVELALQKSPSPGGI